MLDNSASSASVSQSKYFCDETEDKVFLLSYADLCNKKYFSQEYTKRKKTSDYASAKGIYVETNGSSYWILRSPSEYPYSPYVGINCVAPISLSPGIQTQYSSREGIVPALKIKL